MAQVKIHGIGPALRPRREAVSQAEAGLAPVNVEITLTETPRHNWGLKGVSGDDLALDYEVEV